MKKKRDVIIIGCGPAGASSAIQLKRMGFKPLVFEKNEIGGLAKNANLIENYPGFPNGISGVKFCTLLGKQIRNHNIEILFEEIISAEYEQGYFIVSTGKNKYYSGYLIDATGTEAVIPYEYFTDKKLKSKVFFEVKNLLNIKNKKIAVLGGGDAAFDYSLNLSKNNDVSIYNRSSNFRCLDLLFQRAEENKKIEINKNIILKSISSSEEKIKLNFEISKGREKTVTADYVLFAFGRKPTKDFKIKNKNFFCIGDKVNGNLRQISISVGDGVKTAMRIYKSENE